MPEPTLNKDQLAEKARGGASRKADQRIAKTYQPE